MVHLFALGAENKSGILKQAHRSGVRQVVDCGDRESIEIKRGEDISIPGPDILKIDIEEGRSRRPPWTGNIDQLITSLLRGDSQS